MQWNLTSFFSIRREDADAATVQWTNRYGMATKQI